MARARIKINPRGLNEALSSPGVREELLRLSLEVAQRAENGAPVDSGAYRDSIHAEVVDGWVRPRGRVYADVPYAMRIEALTGNLARALSGRSLVRYVAKSGRVSYITQAQFDNYTRRR